MKTLNEAINHVGSMPAFREDYSLRDSIVAYLTLNFYVINNDFEKIVNMEDVAEQSYDMMEAYLLAKEQANEKLERASESLDNEYEAFAEKYEIELVESTDKLSEKLKTSSEALKYYNRVYLVFFKAYKQEMYILEAIENKDINAIEQNRNALISISEEGIGKLAEIKDYKHDFMINSACKRLLTFYRDEAQNNIPEVSDFLIASAEFEKMSETIQAKDRSKLTREEVDRYNKALIDYNRKISRFNMIMNNLNNRRNSSINSYNKAVDSFMERHIPKR